MQRLLVQRISEEFKQSRIRKTVQKVARDNASQILAVEIRPEVEKFKEAVQSSLKGLEGSLGAVQGRLDNLSSLIELEDGARYGSFADFAKLTELTNQKNAFGIMAMRRVESIIRELLIYRSVPEAFFSVSATKNGKSIKADEATTSELFLLLESSGTAKEYITSLMAHIAKKPKREVCKEAKRVFETSDSIVARAAACGILSKVVGDKATFLDFSGWIAVCNNELKEG